MIVMFHDNHKCSCIYHGYSIVFHKCTRLFQCCWWIWFLNNHCKSKDKIEIRFFSTKFFRVSRHYWFQRSFVELEIGLLGVTVKNKSIQHHDTSWESIEQHPTSRISPCTVICVATTAWQQQPFSRPPAQSMRVSSVSAGVLLLVVCRNNCLDTVSFCDSALTVSLCGV
jgi:hypothetical protein